MSAASVYGGGFALQASGVPLPWGAGFNRLCCSATDDHYGIPHFTCHWNASPVYMFVPSFKHQMNSIVVFVPKLNFNSCNSCWCSSYFKQNNEKWSSSMFFGVKLRINWFDKLSIITSQPTRGWLFRPKKVPPEKKNQRSLKETIRLVKMNQANINSIKEKKVLG